ncbi:type VI secretion system family protein [Pseudescherichia vulneris NBRC 102420]|uniref:Type VI secretion system family protein n=1 Tax=Pseudescherichia vulneris NBRC 102420 TaxID=1115515 RepID=A0A090V034_PSEVU|nr:type VI secretion system tube protein TssD [Pseudescherichia vulneris]GAL58230.1 type VI secretion system family protein [Pseudescherichia vulneris NBRC 102420]STQ60301.1 hemolysin-coregulated protein Hcp [Pseudescherichia vulneris]
MSLPAYMYLYDENGVMINGGCVALGREGAIEVMSSGYGVSQVVCSNTGSLMGTRQHNAYTIHKQIDKASPFLANAVCQSKRLQKAIIHYYDVNEAGVEYEIYRVTLDSIVIISVNANHSYFPGSQHHNMIENVAIRYRGIEWYYLEGMIKYEDAWNKNPQGR